VRSIGDVTTEAANYARAASYMEDAQQELAEAREAVRKAQVECQTKLEKFQRASEGESTAWHKLCDVRGNAHQVKA
jgi:hypothetical protein